MYVLKSASFLLTVAALAGCVQPSTRAAHSAVEGYAKVFEPSDPRQLGALEVRAPKMEASDDGRTLRLSSGDQARAVRVRLLDENDWLGAKRVVANANPGADAIDGDALLSALRGGVVAASAEIRQDRSKITLHLQDVAIAPAAATAEWLDVTVDFTDPALLNRGTIVMLQQSGSPSLVRIGGD